VDGSEAVAACAFPREFVVLEETDEQRNALPATPRDRLGHRLRQDLTAVEDLHDDTGLVDWAGEGRLHAQLRRGRKGYAVARALDSQRRAAEVLIVTWRPAGVRANLREVRGLRKLQAVGSRPSGGRSRQGRPASRSRKIADLAAAAVDPIRTTGDW
jgi:hypothetical protein